MEGLPTFEELRARTRFAIQTSRQARADATGTRLEANQLVRETRAIRSQAARLLAELAARRDG